MKNSRRIIYAGRVQGVGFRYSVKQIATGFEVTGWVRNRSDGTVELRASGEQPEVDAFVAAVACSHLAGYIKATQAQDLDAPEQGASGFEIRH